MVVGLCDAGDDGLCHSAGPGVVGTAAAILGDDYAGVLVRDGWAPYRRFTDAAHQTCLAHLLRRARDLARDHPRAPFAARVTITLQQALGIRDRRVAGVISPPWPVVMC